MAKQKKKTEEKKSVLKKEIVLGGVKLVDKAIFAKNMAVMLRSGLTINESLGIAQEQASGKLKKIVRNIKDNVEAGNTLADSMAQYPKVFSGLFVEVTRAGEKSGTLDQSLDNIALQLEKENELVSKVRGAMVYPIVILVATFILGMFMSFLVLPRLTPLFQGLNIDLPFTTRMLLGFADIIENHGTELVIGVILAIIFLSWLISRRFFRPVSHWFTLHTPVIGRITKNANLGRFCRTLGILLKSGIVIEEALEISQNTVQNFYYRRALKKVSERITTGLPLSELLENYSSLFPVIVIEMINVGESSGNLEETLLYLADFYELEVDTATKSMVTVIEPILLIIVGSIVGLLALSIITPIYQLTGNVGR